MRARRWLGGAVGRFRYDVMVLPAREQSLPDGIECLGARGLEEADGRGLLADAPGHRERLAAGDRLVGAKDPGGQIVGVAWLNVVTHVDAYGGRWTAPGPDVGYLNQLLVHPEARGRGIGRTLIRAVAAVAAEDHRSSVRMLVQPGNAASRAAFLAEGARVTHRLFGLRLGRLDGHVAVPWADRE